MTLREGLILEVIESAGLTLNGNGEWLESYCPTCQTDKPDNHGLGVNSKENCFRCRVSGAKGGVKGLAEHLGVQCPDLRGDRMNTIAVTKATKLATTERKRDKKPSASPETARAVWELSRAYRDEKAADYAQGRGIGDALGSLAGTLPLEDQDALSFLPVDSEICGHVKTWNSCIVAPCYLAKDKDGMTAGNLVALQARFVQPKTKADRLRGLGPTGGTVFANELGLAVLRGEEGAAQRVVLVEGMADYLTAALYLDNFAVLGGPGAGTVIGAIGEWVKGRDVFVIMDDDKAGRGAAEHLKKDIMKHGGAAFSVSIPYSEGKKIDVNDHFRNAVEAAGGDEGAGIGALVELIWRAEGDVIKPYTLRDLELEVSQAKPGMKTGFAGLDKLATIPRGAITIVAGRPSHGKTTFLLNLLLNMAEADADKSFFFFSYEESRQQLGIRFLTLLSEARGYSHTQGYLKGGHRTNSAVEAGKERFRQLADSERVFLISDPYFVEDLAGQLEYLSSRYDVGAVLVDYIQKVKIRDRFNTRQLELQKVSEKLLEAANALHLPIILGAQLGRDKQTRDKVRLDNLRECGDIEQDASLVLGLFNPAMEKAQDGEGPTSSKTVDLNVHVLKNRNGPVNQSVSLKFDLPTFKVRDPVGAAQ